MDTELMFSSKNYEWETPKKLFDYLNNIYAFTLDAAATKENALCKKYFTMKDDALVQDWSKYRVFLNSPYGRFVGKFVKKAYEESKKGTLVVCLLPARTDTQWFAKYCARYARTFLITGRLKFHNKAIGTVSPAPFPSMICIFGDHVKGTIELLDKPAKDFN